MKLKDVFLGVLIVALLASEVFMFLAKQRERDAVHQLGQAQHETQQVKADLEQLRSNDETAQSALRAENQNLSQKNSLLLSDNKQLRADNLKLNQQLGTAREAVQLQQQHLQQLQTEPPPAPATQASADADRDTCIANLRSIQVAKAQWALENGKNAADVPTEQDLLTYLPNGIFPACPAAGTYTIGAVGVTPTCSIAGHAIPQ